MTNNIPTPILLDTSTLSKMVSDILTLVGAPTSKKSACLNRVAARIAGPKRNWGFLTSRKELVCTQGMAASMAKPETAEEDHDIVLAGCVLAMQAYGIPLIPGSIKVADWLGKSYLEYREKVPEGFRQASEVQDDLLRNCIPLLGLAEFHVADLEGLPEHVREDVRAQKNARACLKRICNMGASGAQRWILQREFDQIAALLKGKHCTSSDIVRAGRLIVDTRGPLGAVEDKLSELVGRDLTKRLIAGQDAWALEYKTADVTTL